MKRFLIASLTVLVLAGIPKYLSAKDTAKDPYRGFDETVYMDMELEENLKTPEVDKSAHPAVRSYMRALGQNLAKKKYTVDMMRDDEVVLVTIPSDELFLPNDTLLSPSAPARLTPITSLLTDPYLLKVVYAVHTDNTGSPTYNMRLSHERNSSIYEWLLDNVNENVIIIPYEFGDSDPLAPNDSREGRRENRRLEIFLIPGPKLITSPQKGTLK